MYENGIIVLDSTLKFMQYLYDNKVFKFPGMDSREISDKINLDVDEMERETIPYLEYNCFIDGPMGEKKYHLTIAGIDEYERQNGNIRDVLLIRSLRHYILRRLYETGSKFLDINTVANQFRIDSNTMELVMNYLSGKGYVEGGSIMGPFFRITIDGKMAIQNSLPWYI